MMMCEKCRVKEANIVLTTILDGKISSQHLCKDCARGYQAADLQGVLAVVLSQMPEKTQPALHCDHCGTSFDDFRQTGRLGCSQCYTAFRAQLEPIITRIQGAARHIGRKPPLSAEEELRQQKIDELKQRLDEAVAAEQYEQAAMLRDEMRALASMAAGEE